ncbi:MAG: adenylosuccinate lyase [Phycisphaeraceae bacterium]|nr:adenylosuccinate lyase [Phycisphaeraceae bacterium]
MTTSPNDTYTSPLASRNASPEMLRIWSPRHKFNTWRRIWLAVAEAQHEVTKDWATPLVSQEQLDELRAVVQRGITDEEIARASELERDLRHDVMAHVHCLGEQCPKAKGIIHLGCTSQDVVCNADLLVVHQSLLAIATKLGRAIETLAVQAVEHARTPTLGFTHYQSAQPVTVGRRCAGWAAELGLACKRTLDGFPKPRLRGLRGATGTQASFLKLLRDDPVAVDELEEAFLEGLLGRDGTFREMWFGSNHQYLELATFDLTGQTYPRVYDTFILADLASIAAVLHKIATDIRLLSNRKEIDEPFGDKQIGSSAMPYKRNPMKCERICGLTRFVMNLVGNAYDTAATQWLERTLDDSSNRRLSLPEAFLALDGALDLMHQVASGLVVHEAMVRKNLMAELPFLATENILMEAVKLGGDRQVLHEKIRVHAQAAGMKVKQEGLENDLIERLRADEAFAAVHHLLTEDQLLDPMKYVGRSVEQTERFLKEIVEPLRERYGEELERLGGSDRGV